MTDQMSIGCNIRSVRLERGITQREVALAADITTSQLSAYENGKQMPGLPTLAKLATVLNTSLDRLYFGSPSEQFINKSADFGETVVNCFLKLRELNVVGDVKKNVGGSGGTAYLSHCSIELERLFKTLYDYERHIGTYADGDDYLKHVYKSVVNEINERCARRERTGYL